jgi:acetyl-CoA synthetase
MQLRDTWIVAPTRDTPPRMTSYEDEVASFAVEVPARYNPVLDIVERWAAEGADDPALITLDADGSPVAAWSAAELARESRRAARAFLAAGVQKGDRVLVMLPRTTGWYVGMLGLIRIGAIPMPSPNQLTTRDIAFRLERAGATALITDATGVAKVNALDAPPPLLLAWETSVEGWIDFRQAMDDAGDGETPDDPTAADDPMLFFFTSGTVSYPKMVVHGQSYALGHLRTARYWHDLGPGDVHWTIADTGWAKAAWGSLFGQWQERAAVLQANLGRPDPDLILRTIGTAGVTSFCAPPTLYRILVREDLGQYDFSSLRHCTSAGEPLNPEVIRAWREGTGLTVYDGYGQTENTALVANYRCLPVRPGSMGKPTPGYTVRILDEDGSPVPTGEVGNIAVATDPHPVGLFNGYFDDEAANAGAFRDGWYYTGDKARVDEDGYFWFEGRSDDVITSAAYRIGPFEVESALIEHPAVVEAAVVGRPDPERTEIVCAFVVLAAGAEPSDALTKELQDHVKSVTAPYKYPREIQYVEELPKTISGKIRRSELRARLRG